MFYVALYYRSFHGVFIWKNIYFKRLCLLTNLVKIYFKREKGETTRYETSSV